MSPQKQIGKWIIGLWVLNVMAVLIAGASLVFFWDRTPFARLPGTEIIGEIVTPFPSNTSTPVIATETSSIPTFDQSNTIDTQTPTLPATPTRKATITPYVYVTDTPTQQPWMEGPIIIGYSVGGRPLELFRFGSGATSRMIVAGIHGGSERNTIGLADELITYISDHPQLIPENLTLYILRNFNPDGEARAHGPEGRTNNHGVDLNRNFPANWKAEWDKDGCWGLLPVSSGAYAGSEPETVALMIFIQQHKIDALISYHSAALGIFPGGIPPDPASERLAEKLASVSDYPYPPVDTGCEYTGNLPDWASSKGIASVDLELTNHFDTDFNENIPVLKAFINWKR